MDFQSVQTKLIHTVNTLSQSDAAVQVDWASGPPSPGATPESRARSRPGVDFSTAVDALQWRAEQGSTSEDHPADLPGKATAGVPAEVYLKRLNAMAQKINHLSSEQERAIAEMQLIQARLARHYPVANGQGQPLRTPHLNADRAVLAAAEMDGQGNIVLAYRPANPTASLAGHTQVNPGAAVSELASHLRTTYGAVKHRDRGAWSALTADLFALGQEPSAIVARLSRTVWGLGQAMAGLVAPRPSRSGAGLHHPWNQPTKGPSLSLVDGVLWLGGGVIGRLALNLLLAAFPALWSVAVAAITAITAYALYRATLAPRLAFGPAVRVFLLVLGLVIGGQL
ncbi:hypothetical protein PGN35_006290 [Nodosilinea sp. PGN35]|uniref:hypothetical protein n=1 Tax=Nodosilinea sp. PGN35 TaxID=3020489 RepID=UPI0023B32824|nr:hypothetical protein [Nodosilinea sp. TSF1-S3]MDF0367723.1 hypothetical protein [Nodosilinea sp. TSF1-S3]